MNGKVSPKWWISIGTTLMLLILLWALNTNMAQAVGQVRSGEQAQGVSKPAAKVNSRITYQGVLKENGVPVTGPRDMDFYFHTDNLCSTVAVQVVSKPGVSVSNGLFSVDLDVTQAVFWGQGVWLAVHVGGTTIGCEEINPVPYALSLRPGAEILGDSYASDSYMLKVQANGTTYPTASAILGTNATGYAVHGDSIGGWGVYGQTNDGYGVYGLDMGSTQARGFGGFFESMNGVGVYGESQAMRTYNNNFAPGVWGKSSNGAGVYGFSNSNIGAGGRFVNVNTNSELYQVGLWAGTYWGNIIEGHEVDNSGIGMGHDLRFRVTWDGNVYADGSFTGGGADVAERIDTHSKLEPGDVVEIDPDNATQFRLCRSAFSTLVAGVVSTDPGIRINNNDPTDNDSDNRPLLALVGQVPVKVTDENGAIQPGDLLVASSTPGYAMKAGPNPPVGTIIGKALEKLEQGIGKITMLVMLR